jgi:hypothetical protein
MRYPGDGGPDPQVETDHESVEGEDITTEPQEGYVPNRPRRGRHRENRRHTDRLWKKNSKEKVRAKRACWNLRRKFRDDRDISGAGSTIRDNKQFGRVGSGTWAKMAPPTELPGSDKSAAEGPRWQRGRSFIIDTGP